MESQKVLHTTEEDQQHQEVYTELEQVKITMAVDCSVPEGSKATCLIVDLKEEVGREEVSVTVPHSNKSILRCLPNQRPMETDLPRPEGGTSCMMMP